MIEGKIISDNIDKLSDKKIGLALCGGGAKGAAHIGVLQAFKEAGIKLHAISGTSSGSIVACLYACGYLPYNIATMFNMYCNQIFNFDTKVLLKMFSGIYNSRNKITSLASGINLENFVNRVCRYKGINNIKQIKVPLIIPTVDINKNEIVYFSNININELNKEEYVYYYGNIAKIVRASCSYPVLFDPVIYNTKILVDGGVKLNLPANILRRVGCDIVISVSFDNKFSNLKDNDILRIGIRCIDIMGRASLKNEIESSDIVIRPDVSKIGLIDFSKINFAINEGYVAAKKAILDIVTLL